MARLEHDRERLMAALRVATSHTDSEFLFVEWSNLLRVMEAGDE